jgi:hypothetical protein
MTVFSHAIDKLLSKQDCRLYFMLTVTSPPVLIFTFNRFFNMATFHSTTKKSYFISRFFRSISLLFLMFFSSALMAQTLEVDLSKSGIGDSTELKLQGFSDPDEINTEHAWFEFFWIHGNGNFTTNTRDTFIHERYRYPGSFNPGYDAKVYSTSVYRSRGDVPTKMEGQVVTDPNINVTSPDSIQTTKAVKSGYLNLQFNHNEIVPGDTTVWVLSIKNPRKDNQQNTFDGDVYLFFNSPVKIHKSPVSVESGQTDDPDDVQPAKVKTKRIAEPALAPDSDTPRFADFVFDTAFIFNGDFWSQEYNVEGRVNSTTPISDNYGDGLLWHFSNLQGQEERHLFLEFKDAENIFDTDLDSVTRVVDFLAVLTTDAPEEVIADSLDDDDQKIITELQLDNFVTGIAGSNDSEGITPDILNSDFNVSNRIIDVFKVQPLAKRAHDPNQLTIQACACPPESDGAQKLIFTVEFENDGDAPAFGARIAIALDTLIDPESIDGTPLQFFGPGLEADEISFSWSEDKDSLIWELEGMNVYSTKEVGAGNPLTYGQIIFTGLTKPEAKLEEMGFMNACIQFVDHVGLTGTVCTRSVKPTYLSVDESKSLETQEILECQECVFPGCQFPLWLIVLIVLVIGFALWIAFDNS